MGLIVDSSVLIAGERRGLDAPHAIGMIRASVGETEIAISVITLLELAHGVVRAESATRQTGKQAFITDLLAGVPVIPVSAGISLRAGSMDGQCQLRGVRIPLADLLIGATALEMGYGVLTVNPRHFQLVPGLLVRTI